MTSQFHRIRLAGETLISGVETANLLMTLAAIVETIPDASRLTVEDDDYLVNPVLQHAA